MPEDMFSGKCIAVGVTGSIAAYKGVEIVRRLVERGSDVQVLMTESAARFVTPLTFQTLSRNPVLMDLFAPTAKWEIEHVALADKIDALLVAPATANVIAKMACGTADDVLTCLALSTRAPVLVAPAMDSQMFLHAATQANIKRLEEMGYRVMPPGEGPLASGKTGPGRLPDLEAILAELESLLAAGKELAGKKVVVTAGPTWEPIDAVRHITNPSSGKMGYAIAEEASRRGANTILVSGPTALAQPAKVQFVAVRTAREMLSACLKHCKDADAFIAAAAVSDYAPSTPLKGKMKKTSASLSLSLSRTPDIIEEVSRKRRPSVVIGFAAETENVLANARKKLKDKGLDLIVANDVSKPGSGFGSDSNAATLIFRDGRATKLPPMLKRALARHIVDAAAGLLG